MGNRVCNREDANGPVMRPLGNQNEHGNGSMIPAPHVRRGSCINNILDGLSSGAQHRELEWPEAGPGALNVSLGRVDDCISPNSADRKLNCGRGCQSDVPTHTCSR